MCMFSSESYNIPKIWIVFSSDHSQETIGIGSDVDEKAAVDKSLFNCGAECKVIKSVKEPDNTVLIVFSSNDIMVSQIFESNKYNFDKKTSYTNNLLRKCNKMGGKDCYIVFDSKTFYYNSEEFKDYLSTQ